MPPTATGVAIAAMVSAAIMLFILTLPFSCKPHLSIDTVIIAKKRINAKYRAKISIKISRQANGLTGYFYAVKQLFSLLELVHDSLLPYAPYNTVPGQDSGRLFHTIQTQSAGTSTRF